MQKLSEVAFSIDYNKSGYLDSGSFYPFGSFLSMVANLDANSFKNCLVTIIQKFVDDNKDEEFLSLSTEKRLDLRGELVMSLLKLTNNAILISVITNEVYDKVKTLKYISSVNAILSPNYINLENLQNICAKFIEKKYDDLSKDDYSLLSGDNIRLLVKYNDIKEPDIKYCISKIGDLVAFDASNYCKSSILIKKCENCGKYFIPASRSDEIYCDNIYDWKSDRTCKDIGYEIKLSKDAFKSAYRTAYKTQRARIKYNVHRTDYEEKHFKPWDNAAKQALSDYQKKNDIDGFKNWLKGNKDMF